MNVVYILVITQPSAITSPEASVANVPIYWSETLTLTRAVMNPMSAIMEILTVLILPHVYSLPVFPNVEIDAMIQLFVE